MKMLMTILALLLCSPSWTHEGHGEMPTELAKFGGVVGNVVNESKMNSKAHNISALMKAEIVRSEDSTVRIYLYNLKMAQVNAGDIAKEAKGIVENKKAKTKETFSLKAQGDHFIGKIPKQKKRPYNIYITFTKGGENLFVGFDNLD